MRTPTRSRPARLLHVAAVGVVALILSACEIGMEAAVTIHPGSETLDYAIGVSVDDTAALMLLSEYVAETYGMEASEGANAVVFGESSVEQYVEQYDIDMDDLRDQARQSLSAGHFDEEGEPTTDDMVAEAAEAGYEVEFVPIERDGRYGEQMVIRDLPVGEASEFLDGFLAEEDASGAESAAAPGGNISIVQDGDTYTVSSQDEPFADTDHDLITIEFRLQVPGELDEHNASRVEEDGTLVWQGTAAENIEVTYTESDSSGTPMLLLLALLVVAGAAGGLLIYRRRAVAPTSQGEQGGPDEALSAVWAGNTTPPSEPTPAGWYQDPSSPQMYRYWDGARWTEHTNTPGQ